jgi:hypothetical protein
MFKTKMRSDDTSVPRRQTKIVEDWDAFQSGWWWVNFSSTWTLVFSGPFSDYDLVTCLGVVVGCYVNVNACVIFSIF